MGARLVDPLHPLPVDGDVGAGFHQPRHLGAERVTIHSQRAAGGHTGRLGGIEELAAHPAHLLLEQTGSGIQPLGLKAVGADELGKSLALVGRGKVGGFLLIELHLHALARQPERRLAARKAGTQYSNLIFHSFSFSILALSVIASQCHLFPTLSPTVTFLPAPGRIFPKVGGLGSPCKVYLFAKGSPFERLPPAGGRCRASDKGRAGWLRQQPERASPFNLSSAPASQSRSPLLHSRAWSPCGRGWSRISRTWWPRACPRS